MPKQPTRNTSMDTHEQRATASPLPLADGSAPFFHLVEPGVMIQEGDEFLEPDCQTWTRVPIDGGDKVWQRWMIGCRHNPDMMVPYRRPGKRPADSVTSILLNGADEPRGNNAPSAK